MNAVLDAIATRYSCRKYTKEPVSREDLEALALAAVQAPSSRGNAPWRIVVVTDPGVIADISDSAVKMLRRHESAAGKRVDERDSNLFYDAPAVFVIAARRTWDYTSQDLDVGLAVENIAIAATGMGLGTVICGFGTQAFRDFKGDDSARLYTRLGLTRDYEVTITMGVGHPAEQGTPHTPDLSAVSYI